MANLDEAEKQITRFENAYSAGNVDKLWGMTGDPWKEVSSRDEFDDLNTVLTARLGKIEESNRQNFNVNTTNGLTVTVVVMDTSFEQGDGLQTYTFHGDGEDMELVGWVVNSPRIQLTADDVMREERPEEAPVAEGS